MATSTPAPVAVVDEVCDIPECDNQVAVDPGMTGGERLCDIHRQVR